MAISTRRILILPDPTFEIATLRPVIDGGGVTQEAGLAVRQPVPDGLSVLNPRPKGDIRPTVSGLAEASKTAALRLSLSGPVEEARWVWAREEDSTTTDAQVRQAPIVLGRAPAVIVRDPDPGGGGEKYKVRPKLIPGRIDGTEILLLLYLEQKALPFRQVTAGSSGNSTIRASRLTPSTSDRWESPVYTAMDCGGEMAEIVAADAVFCPDTEEFICVIAAQDDNSGPTDRRIYVYHSPDGVIWRTRSRLFIQTSPATWPDPDITLPGGNDTEPSISSLACEILPSGRLVVILSTWTGLWSLISDDRGHTFQAVAVTPIGGNVLPCGVACTVARNGMLLVAYVELQSLFQPRVIYICSGDGVSWSIPIDDQIGVGTNLAVSEGVPNRTQNLCVAIAIRPDGFPVIYTCIHRTVAQIPGDPPIRTEYVDWLGSASFKKRDPNLNDVGTDLFWTSRIEGLHCIESDPAGSLSAPAEGQNYPLLRIDGFHQVEAVLWRGQIVLAAQVVEEIGPIASEDPAYVSNALMIYRTNHWQPLQEILSDARDAGIGIPSDPARGRIYNRTWDCYGLPDSWGFTLTSGGGTSVIRTVVDGNGSIGQLNGGFLEIDTSTAGDVNRYYTDTTLPNSAASSDGVCRFVVQIVSQGANGVIQVEFSLAAVVYWHGVVVQLVRADANTITVSGYSMTSGALLGSTSFIAVGDGDRWYEVIFSLQHDGATSKASGYVRPWRPEWSADPDWDEPYAEIWTPLKVIGHSFAGIIERLRWGHGAATAQTRWKTVQIHRVEDPFPTVNGVVNALRVPSQTFLDDELEYARPTAGDGHHRVDDGIDNFLRGSMITGVPAQYFTRGLSAAWRGRALTEGGFTVETGFDYPGIAVLEPPVDQYEWRSVSGDLASAIEFVWDAGASNAGFRPNAIAMFGRNFHNCTVQLWATDPALGGVPSVSYRIGVHGQTVAHDRKSHLWAGDLIVVDTVIDGHRLTVRLPNGMAWTPWRPSEFASARTGAKFYLFTQRFDGATPIGDPYIYRIRDNTEDTLLLGVDIEADIGQYTIKWAVFSDRFAVEFEHEYPIPGGQPDAHAVSYRWLRFTTAAESHRDADENFQRLGRLVLGTALRLDVPDYEWGWTVSLLDGTDVEDSPSGASLVNARHVPRRVWSVDRTVLSAPLEAGSVPASPNPGTGALARSWVEFAELARRLFGAGQDVALVWEADRANGLVGEANVQVSAHYHEVALVRVTNPGRATHRTWLGQTMNLPGGDDCVPRPWANVLGIEFTEIL